MRVPLLFCLALLCSGAFAVDKTYTDKRCEELVQRYDRANPGGGKPSDEKDARCYQLFKQIVSTRMLFGKEKPDEAISWAIENAKAPVSYKDRYLADSGPAPRPIDVAKGKKDDGGGGVGLTPFGGDGKTPAVKEEVDPTLASWLKQMRTLVDQANTRRAKQIAQKIISNFPNTPEAEEAKGVMKIK